jgi:hypothetical protein
VKVGISSSRPETSRSRRSVFGILTSNGLPIFCYTSKFSTQRLCKIFRAYAGSKKQLPDRRRSRDHPINTKGNKDCATEILHKQEPLDDSESTNIHENPSGFFCNLQFEHQRASSLPSNIINCLGLSWTCRCRARDGRVLRRRRVHSLDASEILVAATGRAGISQQSRCCNIGCMILLLSRA